MGVVFNYEYKKISKLILLIITVFFIGTSVSYANTSLESKMKTDNISIIKITKLNKQYEHVETQALALLNQGNFEQTTLSYYFNESYTKAFISIFVLIIAVLLFSMVNLKIRLKAEKESEEARKNLQESYMELEAAHEELVASEEELQRQFLEIQDKTEELRISRERYQLASIGSEVGVWDWDFVKGSIFFSSKAKELLGIEVNEDIHDYKAFLDKVVLGDKPVIIKNYIQHLKRMSDVFEVKCRIKIKDGIYSWISIRGKALFDECSEPLRIAGSVNNINKEKIAEAKIEKLAYYDELTGLANRVYFVHKFSEILKKGDKNKFAVLFVDLDNFKAINDSLGHTYGDKVLQKIAQTLQKVLLKNITIARFGGDEFILLMNEFEDENMVERFAVTILNEFQNTLEISGLGFLITVSIGIALSPEDGSDVDTLLKHADMAMHNAKSRGKNCYEFYSEELNQRVINRLKLENDLRLALENDEFILYYQPKYDLRKGKITGFEALIRWSHPTRGMISPLEFIPIAEELGLIIGIGEWVIGQACYQLKKWQETINNDLTISINLSAKQFKDIHLINLFKEKIRQTKVDPKYIELEITETAALYDIEYAIQIMKELKRIGVKISLDDFGIGYSSLNYLKSLPINIVKIDKSFISDIICESKGEDIIRAIITLSHAYQLEVVAEGVETLEQLQFLKNEECDIIQGYYISKPVDAEKTLELLK